MKASKEIIILMRVNAKDTRQNIYKHHLYYILMLPLQLQMTTSYCCPFTLIIFETNDIVITIHYLNYMRFS